MRFIMASILFLASIINVYAGADQKVLSPESSFYEQALTKLVLIPKGYNDVITNMLKSGWKEDANIIKYINDNSASLELFKKATLEISDGYIFGRKSDKFNVHSRFPDYGNFAQLFKLLLLEGKLKEIKGQQKEAKEDYLAATRFMIHMSQQRYGIMMPTIVNSICFNFANVYLEESFPNDAPYRDNLLKNLKKIKSNQDFLESAFREESGDAKNDARAFEIAVKKGATFDELFRLSVIDGVDKEQINKYRERSKELTAMLDGEFFAEFYNQVDSRIDEFTSAAIRGARENNSEIYENKIKDFKDYIDKYYIDKLGKPLNLSLWILGKVTVEDKNVKLIVADTMANVYLMVVFPNYPRLIERYWSFYNKLNIVIDKIAGELPT